MYRNYKPFAFVLLATLLGGGAWGQDVFEDGEFKPYDEVFVESSDLSNSVRNRVLYFAHFTCPYCRQAHPYLEEWSRQLPYPYTFEVVPAIGTAEHFPMAIAFYVVIQAAPQRLEEFEKALFSELQDTGRSSTDPDTFRAAAESVGIATDQFDALTQSVDTQRFVQRAFELTSLYGIQEVPTLIVGNEFRTGPARVQNDQQSFIGLLNGLISMHHQGYAQ